jgi:hypothetical protein
MSSKLEGVSSTTASAAVAPIRAKLYRKEDNFMLLDGTVYRIGEVWWMEKNEESCPLEMLVTAVY